MTPPRRRYTAMLLDDARGFASEAEALKEADARVHGTGHAYGVWRLVAIVHKRQAPNKVTRVRA